jgi:phosphate transport system permease protein
MTRQVDQPRGRVRSAASGARSATAAALARQPGGKLLRNRIFLGVLFVAVSVALLGLVLILIDALLRGRSLLSLELVLNTPGDDPLGYRPAILGTLQLVGFMILIVVPIGVGGAVYLEEFANKERWWNRLIELNIQNLAAVPSIVYGMLGLAFLARGPIGMGRLVVVGSMTLALLVLPLVIIASRESIRAVPPSIREGSLALGATQWQTIWHQVLPAAVPGILTGVILAVSRAVGEAAALLMLGAATFVTFDPEPFREGWTALPVQIFEYATRAQPEFKVLAAAGVIVMLGVVLLVNSVAIWLRNRYEQKW